MHESQTKQEENEMEILNFSNKTNEELFAIWNAQEETKKARDSAIAEIQKRHADTSKKHEIVEFIQQTPIEGITIDAVTVISEKPVNITEQWIAELIASKKLPEEKAIYAYSMGRVVSLFLDLQNTHKQVLENQQEQKQTLEEMQKQLTKLNEAQASKEEIDKLNSQIQKKENELLLSNQSLSKLQSELQKVTDELAQKISETQNSEQTIKELQEILSKKELETTALKAQVDEIGRELSISNANIESIKNSHEEELEKLTAPDSQQSQSSLSEEEKNQLESKIEQIQEELKANEDLFEELARILELETYEININSIESSIFKKVRKEIASQVQPKTPLNAELEEKAAELQAKCTALEIALSTKSKALEEAREECEQLQQKIHSQPIADEIIIQSANAPLVGNFEVNEASETSEKNNLVEKLKKPLIYSIAAIAILFMLPLQEIQGKFSSIKSFASRANSNNELREADSVIEDAVVVSPEQSQKLNTDVEIAPAQQQPQQAANTDVFAQNKPLAEQKQIIQNSQAQDLSIYEEPAPKVAQNPQQAAPQVQQKQTPSDYLNSIKSKFVITEIKQLQYNGKLYSKGDAFENFSIAYITPAFIIFKEKNNVESVIRITLP